MRLYSFYIPYLTIIYFPIFVIFGIINIDFSVPRHLTFLSHIFYSLVLGLTFCGFLKFLTVICDRYGKWRILARCRRDLLIGFGGMSVFGIAFWLVPYYWSRDHCTLLYIGIVCNCLSNAFWFLFILKVRQSKSIKLLESIDYTGQYKILLEVGITVQFFIFCGSLSMMTNRAAEMPDVHRSLVLLYHFLYLIGHGFSFMDFIAVCLGGIELSEYGKRKQEGRVRTSDLVIFRPNDEMLQNIQIEAFQNRKEDVEIEAFEDMADEISIRNEEGIRLDSLDCEICLQQYNQHRKPMILKACGHTVCQRCLGQLFAQRKPHVTCPTCRMVTHEKILCTNHSLLDFISDMDRFDALACTECNMRFNDVKLPYILKECGHTVCIECVSSKKSTYIICPSCRKVTHAPDLDLPKNYTLLRVARERAQH